VAVLAQKFWEGIAPICPFITESIFSVLQNRKIRTSYTVCAKKVTPFWYLSFFILVRCVIFAIFVYLHIIYIKCLISEPVQVYWYCRQYRWTPQPDDAPSHCEKHDKLPQKGECFIHQASDVASKQP